MSRLAWAFALVALGHWVYVPGSLDPITFSTLSDVVTGVLLLVAAWRANAGGLRASLPILLVVGPLEVLDYGLSLSDGWFAFHWGFTLILLGALALSWGAWKLRGEDAAGARWLRWGAWLGAAGSLQYVTLAAQPFLFGGETFPAFLIGASLALAGWTMLALASPRAAEAAEAPITAAS